MALSKANNLLNRFARSFDNQVANNVVEMVASLAPSTSRFDGANEIVAKAIVLIDLIATTCLQ